jgi:hypothetical protein
VETQVETQEMAEEARSKIGFDSRSDCQRPISSKSGEGRPQASESQDREHGLSQRADIRSADAQVDPAPDEDRRSQSRQTPEKTGQYTRDGVSAMPVESLPEKGHSARGRDVLGR